jgi:hypothetical protein
MSARSETQLPQRFQAEMFSLAMRTQNKEAVPFQRYEPTGVRSPSPNPRDGLVGKKLSSASAR